MARRSILLSYSAFLLLAINLTSCGPVGSGSRGQSKLQANNPDSNPPAGDALSEVDLSAAMNDTSPSMAAMPSIKALVMTESEKDLQIQWQQESGIEHFALNTDNSITFETSELGAPARLVVDLKGNKNAKSEAIQTPGSKYVQRIRIGKHPGKNRIVFDLAENVRVTHDLQKDPSGRIIIAFADTADLIAKSKQGIPTNFDLANSNTAGASGAMVEMPTAEFAAVKTEGTTKSEGNTAAKLMKLGMESDPAGSTSKVVAEMESAGYYSLVKSAPSEYILTLEGATLSEFASQPIVAPANSGIIRSARAVQSGSDVQVRIFAHPDSFLQATAMGNQIVVSGSDVRSSSMRAQADTEQLQPQAGTDPLEATAPKEVEVEKELEDLEEADPVESVAKVEVSDDEATEQEFSLDDEDAFEDLLEKSYSGRLISLDLQDTDIDNALRIIAEVSNLNIIASSDVKGKVTLRLIDVPWDQALDVILKTNGLDKVQEGNVVRIAPVEKLRTEREALKQAQQAEEELESLKVKYLRISYAKAADLQPLVESVLTERGSVAYDDRTNQLIVKDISKGIKNVSRLVEKIDLRTPQVLVETQIVEANKSFTRELGAELGFYFLRTPETGNALGYNFPNSVEIGGSATDGSGSVIGGGRASSFPAGIQSSALSMLFGSADGTRGLDLRLSQGEREGLVKVISKPSVAVTNNSPAVIKSVERIRIKLPSGGTTIGVGDGANAGGGGGGGGSVATESFEVGIVLNVTAQASPDYYVLMDIEAESSTLGSPGRGADDIPTEIERSATSSVLVSSGQTFAMGGIYKISQEDQMNGVPFIKDIPILGQFFRNSSINTTDQELIFFITPRVVEGSFDDASMQTVS